MRKEDAALMTAEEIARYNESLLCVPGEAASGRRVPIGSTAPETRGS